MKNLLKSKIYGSINNAHRALFTKKKSNILTKKKKNKTKQTQKVCLGSMTYSKSCLIQRGDTESCLVL